MVGDRASADDLLELHVQEPRKKLDPVALQVQILPCVPVHAIAETVADPKSANFPTKPTDIAR